MSLEGTREELGLSRQIPVANSGMDHTFNQYLSLANPPNARPELDTETTASSSSMYRGIVPARNIERRDFAVNGSVVRPFSFSSSFFLIN